MSKEAAAKLFAEVAVALQPPEQLTYSQWAERNFRLSIESSAVPGRFTPWKPQRGILDAIGDETIERVTVIKAARVGYTVSLAAAIGAVAANDPGNIILLVPTDDDARGIIVDDIEPHFKASPALKGIFLHGKYDGRNTLTQKMLRGGGSLKVLSAVAPRKLRRHTARFLFADEVDGMSVTSEGDPIKLIEKRGESFANRKIVTGSTPTTEGTSLIEKRYEQSDKRVFEVPCIHCDDPFEIVWETLHWTPGKPETVRCHCPNCGGEIEEKHKTAIVEAGDWRATRPEVIGHAGFRLSALTSNFANAAWPILVAEYEAAEKAGPSYMQVFHNTTLGRTWSETVDYVPDSELMKRVEPFGLMWSMDKSCWREDVPAEVAYITAGVDVQHNRFEVTFLGHTPNNICVLGHHIVYGDVHLKTTQDDLYSVLMTEWKHPLGAKIGISAAAIDSGDGNTTESVYQFVEDHPGQEIYAIKGVEGAKREIAVSSSRRKGTWRAPLYTVGTDSVKDALFSMAARGIDDNNTIRFSDSLPESWFRQFASEKRTVRYDRRGRSKMGYEVIDRRRNEALDCTVYAYAIRLLVRMDYPKRYGDLKKATTPDGAPRRTLRDLAASLNGSK